MPPSHRLIWISAIALWAVATCFNRLGEAPVYVTNEAREGVYARAMLQSGNFLLPLVPNHVENGELIPDKPPFFHWLAAAATWAREALRGRQLGPGEQLSASFDEWTLRFPSALAGCVMALAVATLGAAFVGERAACFAAAALLTSSQFEYQARFGRVDMMLACLVSLSVLLAGRAIIERRPAAVDEEGESRSASERAAPGRLVMLAGLPCGLAILAKGPLGIVLPALACGAYLLLQSVAGRALHPAVRLPWRRALLVAAAVALPWYLLAGAMSGGAVLRSHLFAENLDQFTGANASMRPWFYLRPWLLDSFPWNLVAVAAVVEAWRKRHRGAWFCAVWWLALLAFFEIAAYKRRAYLLPALPAEVLLAGWFLDTRFLGDKAARPFAEASRLLRLRTAPAIAACAAAALLGWLVPPVLGSAGLVETSWTRADGAFGFAAIAAIVYSAMVLVRAIRFSERWLALLACWGLLAAFYVGIYPTAAAMLANRLSVKRLVTRIETEIPPGRGFTMCGVGSDASLVVLLYVRSPERVEVMPDDTRCPERVPPGFYLLSEEEWRRLGERQPAANVWRERLRGEIRGWSAKTPVVLAESVSIEGGSPSSGGADRLAKENLGGAPDQ